MFSPGALFQSTLSRCKDTLYILIESVCRFVHSKKEHGFEEVGDARCRSFVTKSRLKNKAIVNRNRITNSEYP